jgi:cytochrome c
MFRCLPTKIAAALVIAAGTAALSAAIAGAFVSPTEPTKKGYVVAVADGSGAAPAAAPTGPEPIAALLASADAAAGQKAAKACLACHDMNKGGPNKVGPNLWGVVGAARGGSRKAGFAYSDAMKTTGGNWDFDTLNSFLYSPKAAVPGTKMTFAGIKDTKTRAEVIAYLRTLADSPVALPK